MLRTFITPSLACHESHVAMTDKKLQEFKTRLSAQRRAITDQIHKHEEEEKSLFQERDDELVEQVSDPSLEVLEKLTGSEAKLVDKIDLALSRIGNGSYGICTSCGRAIPLARLEAKPSVSLCRDCQTKHEADTSITVSRPS